MHLKKERFTPAPEGVYNAVCVDVVDLGMQPTLWGDKPKLKLVWEIEAKMDDGRPFLVSHRYGATIHEKSALRKHLKTWRGRDFTKEELEDFDVDKVIGAPCQLVISHNENKEGDIFANVEAVLKATSAKLSPTGKYQRVKDRKNQENRTEEKEMASSDIPF